MKYKNQPLTKRRVINNIMRYVKESTLLEQSNGMAWYRQANKLCMELALLYDRPVINIAGVVAALSPQTSWELNQVYASRFLEDGVNAKANTTANKRKALACLHATSVEQITEILNGNKTKAFFLNIAFPYRDSIATIDRHAVAICLQRPDKVAALPPVQLTDNQYQFFEECYSDVADQLGIAALEVQAITWVTYRRLRNLK